jgi:hypothetical protein
MSWGSHSPQGSDTNLADLVGNVLARQRIWMRSVGHAVRFVHTPSASEKSAGYQCVPGFRSTRYNRAALDQRAGLEGSVQRVAGLHDKRIQLAGRTGDRRDGTARAAFA